MGIAMPALPVLMRLLPPAGLLAAVLFLEGNWVWLGLAAVVGVWLFVQVRWPCAGECGLPAPPINKERKPIEKIPG
jgi:hypothetical protein